MYAIAVLFLGMFVASYGNAMHRRVYFREKRNADNIPGRAYRRIATGLVVTGVAIMGWVLVGVYFAGLPLLFGTEL